MSNTCKYWDCGWCYALDNVETNADSQSACVNPSVCPYWVQTELEFQTNRSTNTQENN